jgi:hypothetical protein
MNGKRLLAGGVLAVAIVIATTSVCWSRPVLPTGTTRGTDPPSITGIAGPAGPLQISPVAAYFKRVTYPSDELGQNQEAGAALPAGRYLVEVLTPGAVTPPDCLGVSFPLVPPHGTHTAFTGYVTVAKSGDDVTVSCFERPGAPTSNATFELYFIPVAG